MAKRSSLTTKKTSAKKIEWLSILKRLFRDSSRKLDREQTRHGMAIAVSLLTAVVFWFTLNMRETYQYELSMKAIVTKIPKGWTLAEPIPETVRVKVSGSGWHLLQLIRRPPDLRIDASKERLVDLEQGIPPRDWPDGVTFESISPKTASIKLAKQTVRWIPVELRGEITPESTFDLTGKPYFQPQFVRVSGPENIVSQIKTMPTVLYERSELSKTMVETVALSDTLKGVIQVAQSEVKVIIPIEQFTEAQRRVRVMATDLPSNINEVQFKPTQIDVVYRIPLSQHDISMRSNEFFATVSYKDMLADSTRGLVIPSIQLPKNLTIRDVRFTPRRLQYYFVFNE